MPRNDLEREDSGYGSEEKDIDGRQLGLGIENQFGLLALDE